MALTEEQKKRLNTASLGFLGGHGRNFLRSMNPGNKEPLEPVQPWGEARAAALNPAPGSPQAAQPSPAQQGPGFHRRPTESSPATAAAAEPQPNRPVVELQPYGVKRAPVAPAQQATVSPGGFTVTPDSTVYGGHVRSIGTPGTDGSGYGYTSGPARQQQSPEAFLADVAQQNRRGRGQVGGYSFEGSGADFAKFAQQPTRPALQSGDTAASERPIYQQVRDRYEAGGGTEKPKYLGPESGLGWKTRLAKYNAELDAYENMTGQRNAMDIAAMREAGAGRQSLLQARGVNDANAIAAARLADDQGVNALDMQAKQLEIQSAQQRQEIIKRLDTATDPNERRALTSQLLAMQGKDPAQKYQVVTRKGFDPATQMPTETPYAVNQDDPSQSFEIRGQGGQGDAAMSVINGNPAYQKAYNAASPEQQAEMLRKVRERLAQGGAR